MLELIAILFGALLGVWIFFPLLKKSGSDYLIDPQSKGSARRALREEKASLVLALRELDFDYETHKLSGADYKALRSKYEARAIIVFKELEEIDQQWKEIQDRVNKEVEKRLQTAGKSMAFFFAFLIAAFPAGGTAAPRGEITGAVIKKMGQVEKPVASAPVRVRIIRGMAEIAGAETFTDNKGNFRFQNLNTEPDYIYLTYTEYDNVRYAAEATSFKVARSPIRLTPIVVYPSNPRPTDIQGKQDVLLEFGGQEKIKVTETVILENKGSASYNPNAEGAELIEFPLKRGGFDLDFIRGVDRESVVIDSQSSLFRWKEPILPGGKREISFSYIYPYDTRQVDFLFPFRVKRTAFNLMISKKNPRIESAQLEKQAAVTNNGETVQVYSGGPFAAGERVFFTVRGLWRTKDFGYAGLLTGILLVLGMGAFIYIHRPAPLLDQDQKTRDRDAGYQALCRLEQDYRAERVTESNYREERERLREFLFDLIRDEKPSQAA